MENDDDSYAMVNLGCCYEKGEGVTQDVNQAVHLYQKAVQKGNSYAMANLGLCYANGTGVEQNWDQAIDLYQQAVDAGNDKAMVSLAFCYQNGAGIEQDWNRAIKLYQRAAEKGNGLAIFNLGVCYQNGIGVEQNWGQAVELYRQAIEKSNDLAMVNLAFCYQNGTGVEQNWNEAVDLFHQAVEAGNGRAMIGLGLCYANGTGVEQNWNQAVDLYKQAVKKGESAAMIFLGICYQTGEGVDQNWDEAINLYQQAIKAGNKKAIDCLQDLLLLQNFLDFSHDKTREIKTCPNIKHPHLTETHLFDQPIMQGDWKQLTTEEIAAHLDKIIVPLQILGLVNNFDSYFGQYGRYLPLSFYKDCNLVDMQFYNPANKNTFVLSAIFNAESAVLLNSEADIIHSINPYLLMFDGEQSALSYLRFFCSYAQGNEGPFQIITKLNEIPFSNLATNQQKQEIEKSFFTPRHIEGCFESEGWQKFEACMLYGAEFYISTFKVFLDGMISLEGDEIILGELPILQRQYDGVFRTPLRVPNDQHGSIS